MQIVLFTHNYMYLVILSWLLLLTLYVIHQKTLTKIFSYFQHVVVMERIKFVMQFPAGVHVLLTLWVAHATNVITRFGDGMKLLVVR